MAKYGENRREYKLDVMEEHEFDTVLEEDISFDGLISFKKSFLIKGSVKGEIKAEGPLLVAEGAKVEARIISPVVLVRGYVKGDIYAIERVDVAASGTVIGNINAPNIFMESGCVFNGNCTMNRPNI